MPRGSAPTGRLPALVAAVLDRQWFFARAAATACHTAPAGEDPKDPWTHIGTAGPMRELFDEAMRLGVWREPPAMHDRFRPTPTKEPARP